MQVNDVRTFADVQDDVVMGTLSVRENLMFSANLRLPGTMSDDEKRDRVDEAIEELGLDKCADTKVVMKWRNEKSSCNNAGVLNWEYFQAKLPRALKIYWPVRLCMYPLILYPSVLYHTAVAKSCNYNRTRAVFI